MSRRTQLTTKYTFSVLSQLSENFIFIYLGLSLFTEPGLEYKPLFILVTVIGICAARWCAVFPLSAAINWFIRYRARRRGGIEVAEEIPGNWKIMIFWAGLRGAVGVALAAGLVGANGFALRATVLVVVVLTVIIFGGTTSRMLEILHIRTGVVEEIDSDDEFDIEPVPHAGGGSYARKNGTAFGHTPSSSSARGQGGPNGGIDLRYVNGGGNKRDRRRGAFAGSGRGYSTGSANTSPPSTLQPEFGRRNSSRAGRGGRPGAVAAAAGGGRRDAQSVAEQGLLDPDEFSNLNSEEEDEIKARDAPGRRRLDLDDDYDDDVVDDDLDLPPSAARRNTRPMGGSPARDATAPESSEPYPLSGTRGGDLADEAVRGGGNGGGGGGPILTARGAISTILNATSEDAGNLFQKLDENYLKPHLLLDPGAPKGGNPSGAV